jgi:hypothetical protein
MMNLFARLARALHIVFVALRYGLDDLLLSRFEHPLLRRLGADFCQTRPSALHPPRHAAAGCGQ